MDQYIDVKQITLTKPTIAQILKVEQEWQNNNPHAHIRDLDLRIVGGIAVGPLPEGMNKAEVVGMLVGRGVICLDIVDPKVDRALSINFTPMFQATKEEWEHITGILDALKEEQSVSNPADEISQAERRRVMLEERRGRTYQGHAIASADEDRGGRFALSGNPATVTGSTPGPVYPQQPSTSPSNQLAMMPDEPLVDGRGEGDRLGYCIDNPSAPVGAGAGSKEVTITAKDIRTVLDYVRWRRLRIKEHIEREHANADWELGELDELVSVFGGKVDDTSELA
jgi:hypothetical protein